MRRLLAPVAVLLLVLAACGDDDDDRDAGDVEPTTTTTEAVPASSTTEAPATTTSAAGVGAAAQEAVADYVASVLRWTDGEISPAADADDGFEVVSPTFGTAEVTVEEDGDGWRVVSLWTFGSEEVGASVSLGQGSNRIHVPYSAENLTPRFTLVYGEDDLVATGAGEAGEEALWEPTLDDGQDTTERHLTVLWVDADGVAVEGWVTVIPAGEFAAG